MDLVMGQLEKEDMSQDKQNATALPGLVLVTLVSQTHTHINIYL